jgi:hypothetical protein
MGDAERQIANFMLQKSVAMSQLASAAYNRKLSGCKLRVIVFEAREQVSVHVAIDIFSMIP